LLIKLCESTCEDSVESCAVTNPLTIDAEKRTSILS